MKLGSFEMASFGVKYHSSPELLKAPFWARSSQIAGLRCRLLDLAYEHPGKFWMILQKSAPEDCFFRILADLG